MNNDGRYGLYITGTVSSAIGNNPHASHLFLTMKDTKPYLIWDPGYGTTLKELDLSTLFN